MYSGVLYFEFEGGIYTAATTMSTGDILKRTQSLNSSVIISQSMIDCIRLYTAIPPRGLADLIGLDLPIRMNSSGHLSRMLRWDSPMITISKSLKIFCTVSVVNFFFIPFMFHDKMLKSM